MNCIGFGEYEGNCSNKAGGKVRPKSPIWCDRCEKLRRVTITQQMEAILKPLGNKMPPEWDELTEEEKAMVRGGS